VSSGSMVALLGLLNIPQISAGKFGDTFLSNTLRDLLSGNVLFSKNGVTPCNHEIKDVIPQNPLGEEKEIMNQSDLRAN
jgi:hypothetical protein